MDQLWIYLIVGLAAGVLGASLGIGGGVLMVPALVVLLAMPQKSAQGISLCVMIPMAIVGAIRYKLNPAIEIDLRIAALIALGAVGGAFVGSMIASHVPASHLRKAFAVLMFIVAIKMFLPSRPAEPDAQPIRAVEQHHPASTGEPASGPSPEP